MKDQEVVMLCCFMILLFLLLFFQSLWLIIVVKFVLEWKLLFSKYRWDRDKMESKQVVYFKELVGSSLASFQNTWDCSLLLVCLITPKVLNLSFSVIHSFL